MPRVRSIALALLAALAVATNLHLPAMQIAAWAGMIIGYSRDATLAEAVEMTFDGEHPCPMCKAIDTAREQTDPDAIQGDTMVRLQLFLEAPFSWRPATQPLSRIDVMTAASASHRDPPGTPPPRTASC